MIQSQLWRYSHSFVADPVLPRWHELVGFSGPTFLAGNIMFLGHSFPPFTLHLFQSSPVILRPAAVVCRHCTSPIHQQIQPMNSLLFKPVWHPHRLVFTPVVWLLTSTSLTSLQTAHPYSGPNSDDTADAVVHLARQRHIKLLCATVTTDSNVTMQEHTKCVCQSCILCFAAHTHIHTVF